MPLFPDMDRRHFDQVIVEFDLDIDDFEISLERDSPEVKRTDSLPDAGTGMVTVVYKPTELSRKYRYSVVPSAEVQFERELRMDLFKTRQRSLPFGRDRT